MNRFGVVYVPNGMIMQNYLPATEGADYEITPTLSALAPFRDQVLDAERVELSAKGGRTGGAHAKATTRFLTDISPPTSETWLDAGISMDQILAQETASRRSWRRSNWPLNPARRQAACDTGYACPYTNTHVLDQLRARRCRRRTIRRRACSSGCSAIAPARTLRRRGARTREQKSLLDSVNAEARASGAERSRRRSHEAE